MLALLTKCENISQTFYLHGSWIIQIINHSKSK